MAMEPMTLYSRNADPAMVARRLRELVKDVKIDGPDNDWRNAVIKVGSWLKKRSLTIKYSPDYCSEPNWSRQMDGMQGYFVRFPDSPAKDIATIIPTSFKIAFSLSFEPDYDPDGDPRLDIVYAIAKAIDGVFFTPSSLRDAKGRVLFCSGGDEYEDPDAEWPKVIAAVALDPSQESDNAGRGGDEEGEECTPPTADRVARRTLALAALTARAMLEQEDSPDDPKGFVSDLLTWIEDIGIHDEIDPDEWEVLQRPFGKLAQQACLNSIWRLEGLVVLAWALGLYELPSHDQLVSPDDLWKKLGLFNKEQGLAILSNPKLRSRDELESQRKRLLALHWRLREFHLRPWAMDFVEFGQECWFGPFDVSVFPLKDGDLCLNGERIDEADHDQFGSAHSAALERHLAINWLCDGPDHYADASIST